MNKIFKIYDSALTGTGYAGQWIGRDMEEAQERYLENCAFHGWESGTLRVVDTGKEFA